MTSYQARITVLLLIVTARIGACGNTKRAQSVGFGHYQHEPHAHIKRSHHFFERNGTIVHQIIKNARNLYAV